MMVTVIAVVVQAKALRGEAELLFGKSTIRLSLMPERLVAVRVEVEVEMFWARICGGDNFFESVSGID